MRFLTRLVAAALALGACTPESPNGRPLTTLAAPEPLTPHRLSLACTEHRVAERLDSLQLSPGPGLTIANEDFYVLRVAGECVLVPDTLGGTLKAVGAPLSRVRLKGDTVDRWMPHRDIDWVSPR